VLASDELQGRDVGTPGGVAATNYIAKQYEALGLEPQGDEGTYFQPFDHRGAHARNVVALLPGQGPLAGEFVIVAAHHDHMGIALDNEVPPGTDRIYNGADDNASGVAALLLIAESLARERDALPASRRGVIFLCTDAEERGLRGAYHYAAHPARPLDKTVYFLNLDMVGRLSGAGKLYANDAESSPKLAELLRSLGRDCGLPVETRIGGGNRSDQLIFLERKIPSAHFVTGLHSDYHRPSDEVDKLDSPGAARIAWLGASYVRGLIERPGPFVFQPIAPAFDAQHALGLVGRLGLVPELNTQDGRYPKVSLVVPGSAAAKAGLRAGDQITAFNGQTFDRLEDTLVIFSQLRFDKGLTLTVLRGAESVDINVPAEVFARFAGPPVRKVEGGYEATFTFQGPLGTKKTVYLAGSFNDWQPTAHRMDGPDARGRYTTTLKLQKGTYEYKFVVDGKDWLSDPDNLHQAGPYHNSVLWVGQAGE
jgi:hypothetical protein